MVVNDETSSNRGGEYNDASAYILFLGGCINLAIVGLRWSNPARTDIPSTVLFFLTGCVNHATAYFIMVARIHAQATSDLPSHYDYKELKFQGLAEIERDAAEKQMAES